MKTNLKYFFVEFSPALLAVFAMILLTMFFVSAAKAQHVVADPWASTVTDQPDGVAYSVGGGAAISCLLKPIVGGTQMDCDLAVLNTGVHQLAIVLTKNATCTNPIPGVEGKCTTYTPLTVSYRYTNEKKPVAAPTNLRLSGP
jgi:hypothetical protein